eukprot:354315-Chlamydomonas_euryale.AAC.4
MPADETLRCASCAACPAKPYTIVEMVTSSRSGVVSKLALREQPPRVVYAGVVLAPSGTKPVSTPWQQRTLMTNMNHIRH